MGNCSATRSLDLTNDGEGSIQSQPPHSLHSLIAALAAFASMLNAETKLAAIKLVNARRFPSGLSRRNWRRGSGSGNEGEHARSGRSDSKREISPGRFLPWII